MATSLERSVWKVLKFPEEPSVAQYVSLESSGILPPRCITSIMRNGTVKVQKVTKADEGIASVMRALRLQQSCLADSAVLTDLSSF